MAMTLTFTNGNGDSKNFTSTPPYIFQELLGAGGPNVDTQTQKSPYQSGRTVVDQVHDEMPMTLHLTIISESRQKLYDYRRTLSNLFNAKWGEGTLRWVQPDGSTTYEAKVRVDDKPHYPGGQAAGPMHQEALINLTAYDPPYWYDPVAEEIVMSAVEGGWSFPWSFPLTFGTIGKTVTVTNEGDVNAPVLITITGYVNTPSIVNETTGETIEIAREIPEHHTMEIYTGFGDNRRIEIINTIGNKTNAFHWRKTGEGHSLWTLQPGDNEISYSAANEGASAQAIITFYHYYSGI